MKIQDPDSKEKLTQRLRRIEGQVRGVVSMLDEGRDCCEVLQQLTAIRSAVQGASRLFIQEYATACLHEMEEEGAALTKAERNSQREKLVQDMIALLDKAP